MIIIDKSKADIDIIKNNTAQNKADVDDNENSIEEIEDIINNLRAAPVGTILAWVPKPTKGQHSQHTPDLNSADSCEVKQTQTL